MISFKARKRLGAFLLDAQFESADSALGVFGPSGQGKTTLLRLLSGLLEPDQGEIVFQGRPLFSSSLGINLPARERGVGYVFQEPALFPHLDVRGNLLYGYKRSARRGVSWEDTVRMLGLEPLLGRSPRFLSGGEAQRVLIGRALLRGPSLLLLDEPLSALDERMKDSVLSCLEEALRSLDIPLIYVSHSLREITRLTRRVLVLREGRCAYLGEVSACPPSYL